MLRGVIPRAYNAQLYSKDLAAALSQRKIFDPDYALVTDPDIYDKLRRYPPVDGAVDLRKRMVAGSDWFLSPASKSVGDRAAVTVFTALLQKVQAFETARYHLAEALIKGSAWAEMILDLQVLEIEPLPPMLWWVVIGLRDEDKRRFCLIKPPGGSIDQARWHKESLVPPYETTPIFREHYVRVAYGTDEASLGYGRGLTESILYPFWYASGLDEHGNQFGERWAQGFRIWKVGNEGPNLTADKVAKYLAIVDTFVSRYAAVVGKDSDFELVDAPAEALEFITQRQDYYNALIRTRILGSSLTTDPQVEGGSYAMADSQFENTTQLMVHHDRGVIDEGLTHDLLGLLWRLNYQNFLSQGIRTTGPSKFHTRDLKQQNPQKRVPIIESLAKLGVPQPLAEIYNDCNVTPPAEGEPVLKGMPAKDQGGRPKEGGDRPEAPSQRKQREELEQHRKKALEGLELLRGRAKRSGIPKRILAEIDERIAIVRSAPRARRSSASRKPRRRARA